MNIKELAAQARATQDLSVRPKKLEDPRHQSMTVTLTQDEYDVILAAAKKTNRVRSEFLRDAVLPAAIKVLEGDTEGQPE